MYYKGKALQKKRVAMRSFLLVIAVATVAILMVWCASALGHHQGTTHRHHCGEETWNWHRHANSDLNTRRMHMSCGGLTVEEMEWVESRKGKESDCLWLARQLGITTGYIPDVEHTSTPAGPHMINTPCEDDEEMPPEEKKPPIKQPPVYIPPTGDTPSNTQRGDLDDVIAPQEEIVDGDTTRGPLSITLNIQESKSYIHFPFIVDGIETVGDIVDLLNPSSLHYYDGQEKVRATSDSEYVLAPHQCFQVRMSESIQLDLRGNPYPEDANIEIVEGWQWFGFPRQSAVITDTKGLYDEYPNNWHWMATYRLDGTDRIMLSSRDEKGVPITAGMCFYANSRDAFTIELDGAVWGDQVATAPQAQRHGTLTTSWGAIKQER